MRLIDADALKEKLEEIDIYKKDQVGKLGVLKALIAIEEAPTIEKRKTGKWIPCSETEELPKHEVLCCDKYGEELIGWLSYDDDQWICESDGEMMYDPIAWRELPEPYKGEI